MRGSRRIVCGCVVVTAIMALTASVGWAQQQPRPKPLAVATPAAPMPAAPAAAPRPALGLHLVLPQAAVSAGQITARALAIPTPPAGGYGIVASAAGGGGRFFDTDGGAQAWLGTAGFGIQASGTEMGGLLKDADNSGYALLGSGDYGIQALGNEAGGYFKDADHSGYAYAGYGDWGIQAFGNTGGGYFYSLGKSGLAVAANGDEGIYARGNDDGGYFWDGNNDAYAYVASGTAKIQGNGSVSFVQNHPADPGAVIVYAAPEGDEVATYTRGTARLAGGEARVPLGETFKWVTDPDVGLTAYLTPVGGWCDLYVAEKGTSELLVRSRDGSDCTFDYMVYGLRIGFEETAVVQEKKRESYIPSMKDHRELLARRPDLARYTALARYSTERQALGTTEELKLDRANALKAAIHEFDPAVDQVATPGLPQEGPPAAPQGEGTSPQGMTVAPSVSLRHQEPGEPSVSRDSGALLPLSSDQDLQARSFSSPREPLATRMAVAGDVEPGDVLVVDPEHPELFARGDRQADPTVVGVVVANAGVALGAQTGEGSSASVALAGIARCKVDASFGAIARGDLLVSSPTPGHAMRDPSPLPGTVVGKALEPLATGQGSIRILVTLR